MDELVEKIAEVIHAYYGDNKEPVLAKQVIQAVLSSHNIIETIEFAGRVAKVMDDLRSSHVFFVLQQA